MRRNGCQAVPGASGCACTSSRLDDEKIHALRIILCVRVAAAFNSPLPVAAGEVGYRALPNESMALCLQEACRDSECALILSCGVARAGSLGGQDWRGSADDAKTDRVAAGL